MNGLEQAVAIGLAVYFYIGWHVGLRRWPLPSFDAYMAAWLTGIPLSLLYGFGAVMLAVLFRGWGQQTSWGLVVLAALLAMFLVDFSRRKWEEPTDYVHQQSGVVLRTTGPGPMMWALESTFLTAVAIAGVYLVPGTAAYVAHLVMQWP